MPYRRRNLRVELSAEFDERRRMLRRRYSARRDVVSFDVETITNMRPGGYPRPYHGTDAIFAWQTSNWDGTVRAKRIVPRRIDPELQALFDDASIAKVAHNYHYELTMLHVDGYRVPEETVWHDTMIMSQLLKNLRPSHKLEDLGYVFCGWDRSLDYEVHKLARRYGSMHLVPHELMRRYQIADAQRTMILFRTFWPEIERDPDLLADYVNEIELVRCVREQEQLGMLLDEEEAQRLADRISIEADDAGRRLREIAGTNNFNPASASDVSWLLHGKLRIPVMARTRTGKISTKRVVFDQIKVEHPHEALELIDKYRAYALGATTVRKYASLADANGIVHPDIQSNRASTGRLSCSRPNLHNVAKDQSNKTDYTVPARGVWRARPGTVLWFKDQSAIEIRLIVERAQCARMIELMQEGRHPHVVFCEMLYGRRYRSKSLDRALYDSGKNGHFALCYGAGVKKIAPTVGLSVMETEPGVAAYRRTFPEIAELARNEMLNVRKYGTIKTPFGRTLQVPEETLYAWLNYYIQGTAAGIIKRGQVQCRQALISRFPDVKMVLSIHDEIVFQVPAELHDDPRTRAEISAITTTSMIDIERIAVPLDVEQKVTRGTWIQAEEF